MVKEPKYKMEIDINVLNHLGINLYSNAASVLSEVVANAWDADASEVRIKWEKNDEKYIITIEDDGTGLSLQEINERFLRVGYQRRISQGPETKKRRKPMGRKGIGKLSLFSIAKQIEVHTSNGKDENAFQMDIENFLAKQKKENSSDNTYQPEDIVFNKINSTTGTKIIIKDFNKKVTKATISGLKCRVARRFTILTEDTTSDEGAINNKKFDIYINDEKIKIEDRGYYDKIQVVWTYGKTSPDKFKNIKESFSRENVIDKNDKSTDAITVTGWLGTVKNTSQLKDKEYDNLNKIAIYIRGKMAKDDMLKTFSENSIYASYLVGELNVDWMDVDDDTKNDMATTNRQDLDEDDERYKSLKSFIGEELKNIGNRWRGLRGKYYVEEIGGIPEVEEWLKQKKKSVRKKAEKWIGQLGEIRTGDTDKKELLKALILAFEFYEIKESLEKLDKIDDNSIADLLDVFNSIDTFEASLYGQIVKGRLKVIEKFQEIFQQNEKEEYLKRYIFEHLWLLDPSFERASIATSVMEKKIDNFLKEKPDLLLNEEGEKGRIDIGYRTVAGKHVVVELKRPSVKVGVNELYKQIQEYCIDITKILSKHEKYKEWPLEIIVLLGETPIQWNEDNGKHVKDTLARLGARIVFYDILLRNAQEAYAKYLEKSKDFDKLRKIFEAIEDFAPNED